MKAWRQLPTTTMVFLTLTLVSWLPSSTSFTSFNFLGLLTSCKEQSAPDTSAVKRAPRPSSPRKPAVKDDAALLQRSNSCSIRSKQETLGAYSNSFPYEIVDRRNADTVVILHGSETSKEQWHPLACWLYSDGYQVLIPNLAGLMEDQTWSPEEQAEALHRLFLVLRISRQHIAANSDIGAAAIAYAGKYQRGAKTLALFGGSLVEKQTASGEATSEEGPQRDPSTELSSLSAQQLSKVVSPTLLIWSPAADDLTVAESLREKIEGSTMVQSEPSPEPSPAAQAIPLYRHYSKFLSRRPTRQTPNK